MIYYTLVQYFMVYYGVWHAVYCGIVYYDNLGDCMVYYDISLWYIVCHGVYYGCILVRNGMIYYSLVMVVHGILWHGIIYCGMAYYGMFVGMIRQAMGESW